jgi:hypothetical protein
MMIQRMQRCKLRTQTGQNPFFEDQWNQKWCQLYLELTGQEPGQLHGIDRDEIVEVQVEPGD